MTSFKTRLALYFLLLALLPSGAVFWAFSSVAAKGETQRVDVRIEAGLRVSLASYEQELAARSSAAETLARDPRFQQALERRDLTTLRKLLAGTQGLRIRAGSTTIGRAPSGPAASHVAEVRTQRGPVGSVVAALPFDADLLTQLRGGTGLISRDTLAFVEGGRLLVSVPAFARAARVAGLSGVPHTARVDGTRYRILGSRVFQGTPAIRLVVLTPQHPIDAATSGTRLRLLLFIALVLVGVGLLAYAYGRAIVRTVTELAAAAAAVAQGRRGNRVPVRGRDEFAQLGRAFNDMADQLEARLAELESERARLREAFARFGDALSATHDPDQLLRLVLDATMEATSARGAALVDDRGGLVHVGDLDTPGERLELPLTAGSSSFGTLVLVGASFGDEERLTANSLAAHAVVALENARLHGIVERQALVDGLTGLANRRHCEEALAAEVARADRFGSALTAVFADLDDFKQVNDLYGHATGDLVLREFATVLRENVREADVAGRWGGEEFLLLLPGTDAAGGVLLAERVRTALERRTILAGDGTPLRLTCSLGVGAFPAAADADALLAAADDALYRAKHAGKNRVETAGTGVPRP